MERLLLEIVDTVREPLLVLDESFCVARANRAFFRTFLVAPEDTIGQQLFLLGDGQWDIPALRELLHNRLPIEAPLYDFAVDHVFPVIGRKIMVLNARLVAQGATHPRVILLSIEDVTARRMNEEHLASQRLELQRSNEALEEFASVASHDLQEPLRKIVSFGERLDMAIGATLDGDARTYLDRMLSSAERMRVLINDLLAYSRITANARPFEPADLGQIAAEVVADLDAAILSAGARIEVEPLPVIQADALQMRQLLQNLISNALKYRREDVASVVTITASAADGRSCTLAVTDNGIGFKQRYAEQIFKMFERLHGRGQYDGSGIGLAICQKIVHRHGGTISATGRPGEGATFSITLPIMQEAAGVVV
jgi:signal transduction histidine kinase